MLPAVSTRLATPFSEDCCLLSLRVFAVDLAAYGLADLYWADELSVHGAYLNLVYEPVLVAFLSLLCHIIGCDIVLGECELLVFVVFVVVVVVEVSAFFRCYDSLHQLDSGVVLA